MKIFILIIASLLSFKALAQAPSYQWVKIKASTKEERTEIVNKGISIDYIADGYVVSFVPTKLFNEVKDTLSIIQNFNVDSSGFPDVNMDVTDYFLGITPFIKVDSAYHDYKELQGFITKLVKENPDIVSSQVLNKTLQGRDITHILISTDQKNSHKKPGIVITAGHHAREHLTGEMAIELARYLVDEYRKKNPEVVKLVESREIHILPLVNPDGSEYDLEGGYYKYWRKNRSHNYDGSRGVDLNRNYGYKWGTGGSSKDPRSEVYMGTKPFSEIETQTVKKFIESRENLTISLSLHAYGQLIFYPWSHTYNSIPQRDFRLHKTMAETMAKWNGYKPQPSSGLYIASGVTQDWTYGVEKLVSFTFELDPSSRAGREGFYPGNIIQSTFKKNLKPFLYLIEYSDNPYRVIDEKTSTL